MKKLFRWMAAGMLAVGMHWAAAAPTDVPLGAGDVIKVSVYNNPDLATETRVNENGLITVPLIGQVPVAGLSTAAAEKKIAALLGSGGFVKNAQVNLLVTVQTSQQVSVLGQVNRPGRYPLDSRRTVMDVLAQAGGIAADGGDTVSLIRKKDGVATRVTSRADNREAISSSTISFDGSLTAITRRPSGFCSSGTKLYRNISSTGTVRNSSC